MRYVFGERRAEPLMLERDVANPADPGADLTSDIHDVIGRDWSVIGGYFLILFTCSVIFMVIMLAFSNSARNVSFAIFGAVIVAAAMDIGENIAVLLSRNTPQFLDFLPDRFWFIVPAALATVKWCALIVAIFAVPAAIFAVWRVIVSYISRWKRREGGKEWWDRALTLPEPGPPPRDQDDVESTWRQAFYVPGADDLLTTKDGSGAKIARTASALCLSGGGIRSGCVAMGAMQTLSREPDQDDEPPRWDGAPLLDGFDYIISVSGGGYTAGARLLAIQKEETGEVADEDGRKLTLADRFSPGSPEFAFLRRRASYIADSPIGLLRALAEVLKNLIASMLLVFLVAVIVGWIFGWFVARLPLAAIVPWRHDAPTEAIHLQALDTHLTVAAIAVAIPLAFALILGAAGLLCEYFSTKKPVTVVKDGLNMAAGAATLLALLVLAVTVTLPGLMLLCAQLLPNSDNKVKSVAAFGGVAAVVVALQYVAAIISMVTKKKEESGDSKVKGLRKMLPPGVVQLMIVLLTLAVLAIAWLLVLGIAAAQVFDWVTQDHTSITPVPHWGWILLGLALLVVVLSCVDVTSLSLHPFYRGRLARATAVRRIKGDATEYPSTEGTWLDRYGKTEEGGPKFVFAAAAALSGDAKPAPGLNAVSYVLSADYIGGPALGWLNTEQTIKISASRINAT